MKELFSVTHFDLFFFFPQFGFDGLFFGRLDFQDKATRQKLKTMEMLWQGSPSNLSESFL